MSVTVGEVMDFLGQLVPVLLGIGVLYMGLRKWIKKVATNSEAAATQLSSPGATTVAEDVRSISQTLDAMNGRLDEQERVGAENRERSVRAETLAWSAHERIDRHLMQDHGVHLAPRETKDSSSRVD
jgi:flagellar biosynthesis/type III secretory pathway M-ring protein FliF/YscJ